MKDPLVDKLNQAVHVLDQSAALNRDQGDTAAAEADRKMADSFSEASHKIGEIMLRIERRIERNRKRRERGLPPLTIDEQIKLEEFDWKSLLGKTREEIVEILGKPDDTSVTTKKHKTPGIYVYSEIELHFLEHNNGTCWLVFDNDEHKRIAIAEGVFNPQPQPRETMRLADVDEHQRHVIQAICPELHDVALHKKGNVYVDSDFYFKDDPRNEEEGYLGCGLNEFVPGSVTYEKLVTILYVLVYCNELEFEDG